MSLKALSCQLELLANMSRPKEYDDEELLLIMAELLAWPTITNVTEYNAAAEKTLSFILGSDQWAEHVTKQTIDRLLKAFRVDGQHRILQARAQVKPARHG